MAFPIVPQPGPAQLRPASGPDDWLEAAKACKYLPESTMKQLCEMVKDLLMEESNVQPVKTPVTICGDIHGQFYDLLELFRVAGGLPNESSPEAPIAPSRMIRPDELGSPVGAGSRRPKRKFGRDVAYSGLGHLPEMDDEFNDDDDDDVHTEIQSYESRSTINDTIGQSNGDHIDKGLNQSFVFLGDFVDRGYFSLETFTLLMCLKAKYPDKITLVRGNHESRQITQIYGFYDECQSRYGNASVWKACCQVFDFLALAAIIDGKVLCVHGGLSPEVRTLDQVRVISRAQEIPHEGAFCDLVWSDPEDVDTWAVSPRGAGWLFGSKVAEEFNHVNGLNVIARAHQLVNEGYKYHFANRDVVTVWSAPNYCYRCGNVASIMTIKDDLSPTFTIFSAVPDDQRAMPVTRTTRNEYFL